MLVLDDAVYLPFTFRLKRSNRQIIAWRTIASHHDTNWAIMILPLVALRLATHIIHDGHLVSLRYLCDEVVSMSQPPV
jgi:hypothetical protein